MLYRRILNKLAVCMIAVSMAQCNLPGLDRFLLDLNWFSFFVRFSSTEFSIGGRVDGLEGSGLVLNLTINSEGEPISRNLPITEDGEFRFSFPTPPSLGSTYRVAVLEAPSNPFQFCEIGGAEGSIGRVSIQNILVQCSSTSIPMPVFSPLPGEFSSPVEVMISSVVDGASIFFTVDGSDPTCNFDGSGLGTLYSTPVSIPQPSLLGVDLRAIACRELAKSSIQTGLYRVTNGTLELVTSSLGISQTFDRSPSYSLCYIGGYNLLQIGWSGSGLHRCWFFCIRWSTYSSSS